MKTNRRLFCLQFGMTLVCFKALAQELKPPTQKNDFVPMPVDRADDSYAILSLLIPVLQKTKKEYLISDTTTDPSRDAFPQTPAAQTKPPMPGLQAFRDQLDLMDVPDDRLTQFQEAVEDYIRRKGEQVQLERKFYLPLPYRLMDSKLVKKYKGKTTLSWMSEVYFDRARTLGLVCAMADDSCNKNWYAFEKQGVLWKQASWKDIGTCEQA